MKDNPNNYEDYENINDQFADLSGEIEGEDDLTGIDKLPFSKAFVSSSDWTTETILNQLKRGNIILNVRFQRRDAWRPERKSKFIESLILGLPVPQLVLAEARKRKGSYIVIDGKQRLLSIRQFASTDDDIEKYDKLKLSDLEIRKDLNGKSLQDLENDPLLSEDLRSFQNETIRTVVVRNWPNEDYLYLVFLRLNTGSVKLSPQELRQALHPGPFVNYVDDRSIQNKILQKVLRLNKPDFRMRDVELLVRYYAFRNFITEYKGNLKAFLDITCGKLNSEWNDREEDIINQANELDQALEITLDIFGEDAFRKWDGIKFENRFNRAIFDIMVFYFADKDIAYKAKAKREFVITSFKKLCEENTDFLRSIETTTKSIDATINRLSLWGNSLRNLLQIDIRIPRLIDNKISY